MLESLSFEDYVDDPENDPLTEATPKGKLHYELCLIKVRNHYIIT